MSRRTIAVALAAAGAIAAIATTNGSAQAPEGRTLTFEEKTKGSVFTVVQHKRKQLKVGDHVVLALPLYDAAGAKQGVARATCSVTGRRGNDRPPLMCSGVFALRDGDIAVVGRIVAASTNRLAVVGGTGAYAGARGTLTSTNHASGSTDVLDLLP